MGSLSRSGVEYINSRATRLILRDLMKDDSGMYTCYIGPLTNSVIITVQGKTLMPTIGDKTLIPTFRGLVQGNLRSDDSGMCTCYIGPLTILLSQSKVDTNDPSRG